MSRVSGALAACAVLTIVMLTIAAGGLGSRATEPRRPGLWVRIDRNQQSHYFHRGAAGLSIETSQLSSQILSPRDRSLVALMRRFGPATLRIGGNSADRSWWTAEAEPMPSWATNTVTPEDLGRLRLLLDAVDWQVILTVNLGDFEPRRAASEAQAALRILGPKLHAIEIGNEPNGFGNSVVRLRPPSYGVDDYLRELDTYQAYIQAAAPGVPLAGPDLSSAPSSHTWLPQIVSQNPPPFGEITQHYYPTAYNLPYVPCQPTPYPTARDLLAPSVREREDVLLAGVMSAGTIAHRPTRISETNTTSSCNAAGGPDTSPVFASALWALDWTLRATNAGVSSLNFHSNLTRCAPYTFSPICTPADRPSTHAIARAEYYGLIAATNLEGGHFVSVRLAGRRGTRRGFTAYATERGNGTLTLAIIDFLPRGRTNIAIVARGYATASGRSLYAPSIHARRGVRFGGAVFGADGLSGPVSTQVQRKNGAFRLTIRAGSAQIVTLTPASN